MHSVLRSILNLDNNVPQEGFTLLARLLSSIVGPVSLGFYMKALSDYNSDFLIRTQSHMAFPALTSLAIFTLWLNELNCVYNFYLAFWYRRSNTTTYSPRVGYGIMIDLVIWVLIILSLALNEHMAYAWVHGNLETSPPCNLRDPNTGDVLWNCTSSWATIKSNHHIADMIIIAVL